MSAEATCKLCPWRELWSTRDAAEASCVWHVYFEHPLVWREAIGSEREPDVKNLPAAYGELLEPWVPA